MKKSTRKGRNHQLLERKRREVRERKTRYCWRNRERELHRKDTKRTMRRENEKKEYNINIEERHWRDIKDKGEKNELRYKEN